MGKFQNNAKIMPCETLKRFLTSICKFAPYGVGEEPSATFLYLTYEIAVLYQKSETILMNGRFNQSISAILWKFFQAGFDSFIDFLSL